MFQIFRSRNRNPTKSQNLFLLRPLGPSFTLPEGTLPLGRFGTRRFGIALDYWFSGFVILGGVYFPVFGAFLGLFVLVRVLLGFLGHFIVGIIGAARVVGIMGVVRAGRFHVLFVVGFLFVGVVGWSVGFLLPVLALRLFGVMVVVVVLCLVGIHCIG